MDKNNDFYYINRKIERKIEYLKTIKDYVPTINDISKIKLINMDNHHLYNEKYKGIQLTKEIFNSNSNSIIIVDRDR